MTTYFLLRTKFIESFIRSNKDIKAQPSYNYKEVIRKLDMEKTFKWGFLA